MTFFRNVVWFCKGLKEYTKSGFETASKKFNPSDLEVSCNGQSYMITGANSGLGKQVCNITRYVPITNVGIFPLLEVLYFCLDFHC